MRPPLFFWVFNSPSPRPQGPMDPTGGEGTSADIVPTKIIFGVDPVLCVNLIWYDIAQKPPKCKKFPVDSHSNENFICLFFRPPGAANPQTTSFPSLVFALPWAKISRRSHHPALRYPQPYKKTKKTANLISRQTLRYATLYGEIIKQQKLMLKTSMEV